MALFEGENILSIIEIIAKALKQHKINVDVAYRLKHPKSVLEKMAVGNLALDEIKDLIAFRFIVQEVKDCYDTLDIIKQVCIGSAVNKKDYIAYPKDNGYRSLHILICDNHVMRNVEIQVRTKDMHNIAEYGSARHSAYKNQKKSEIDCSLQITLTESITDKAYEIWQTFKWTIPELYTYEEELKKIWHIYKAEIAIA